MSEVRTNSITDAAGTGAPDFPNGINAATALVSKVDDTERMRIDSSGNVGIGTSSPTAGYRLDVFGQAQIGDGGGNADINFNASNTGRFLVAGTERMRIDASGNVLVGKTTSTGSRFEVERTDSDNAIADFKTNNASGDLLIRSSGGYVRVRSTGTNEMAFLSAGTERMRIDSAGTLQFNSGYGSVAPAYGCRAWVNFNGTGTVAIRASGNVSSITDLGTGAYRVNFATAMPDANYAVATSGEGYTLGSAGALQGPSTYSLSTSSFSLACGSNTNSLGGDWPTVSAAVFR
jgi:hypothetical protein